MFLPVPESVQRRVFSWISGGADVDESLPEAAPGVSVTPWGEATRDDWLADHIRFSLRWDARYAGNSFDEVTADACAIAARLLTEAGLVGAATLHTLPIVEFKFDYLVRPLKAAGQATGDSP